MRIIAEWDEVCWGGTATFKRCEAFEGETAEEIRAAILARAGGERGEQQRSEQDGQDFAHVMPPYGQFTTLGKTACESSLPESPEIVKHPAKQTLRGGRRRRIREPARVLCAECGDIPLGICRVIQNRIAQADDGKCFTARSR